MFFMAAPKCGFDVDVPSIQLSQQDTRLEDAGPSAYFLPARLGMGSFTVHLLVGWDLDEIQNG